MRINRQRHLARRIAEWICLVLVLVQANCLAADSINEVPPTQRIASLGPSLTRQLYLLGVAPKIVGITTHCPQPSGLAPIEIIGSVMDPNVERIVRLQPDLVLATPLTKKKRIAALSALHVPVVEYPPAKTFEEVCEQFLDLGKQVERETEAVRIVRDARAEAATIRKRISLTPPPTVFIQVGARPLSTVGKDCFLNDLIAMAGGSNIAENAKIRTYSRESVLAANPDCILIITMGLVGADEQQKWRQYDDLAAAKNDRIYQLSPELVCSPTPESFVDALALLAGLLHPVKEGTQDAEP